MKRSLSTRAVTRGLAPTEPTDNVLVAYAARDGTTASDGDSRNSPFTTALLKHIDTPGLEISFLFRNVRDEVMSATKREQQPFVYGSLSKEAIYLKPLATPTVQATATPSEAPASTEDQRVWNLIKTSRDSSLFEDFLRRYASSPHAADVRQRLANLKSTQVASVAPLLPASDQNRQFTPEDAQRVATMGTDLKLKMPPFVIGDTKVDAPVSFRRYVGIWVRKVETGKERQRMLILTEAGSDGRVVGYHVYGAAGTLSWTNEPAGYIKFVGKISDNVLRFNSGKYPVEVRLSGANAITMLMINPDQKSNGSGFKLTPLWQLMPNERPAISR